MKGKFTVYGMTCAACVAAAERNVKKLDGVSKVGVNLSTGALLCEYDENKVSETDIINAVTRAGYKAERYRRQKAERRFRFQVLFLASVLALVAVFVHGAHGRVAASVVSRYARTRAYKRHSAVVFVFARRHCKLQIFHDRLQAIVQAFA